MFRLLLVFLLVMEYECTNDNVLTKNVACCVIHNTVTGTGLSIILSNERRNKEILKMTDKLGTLTFLRIFSCSLSFIQVVVAVTKKRGFLSLSFGRQSLSCLTVFTIVIDLCLLCAAYLIVHTINLACLIGWSFAKIIDAGTSTMHTRGYSRAIRVNGAYSTIYLAGVITLTELHTNLSLLNSFVANYMTS
jgi:hypothetical protein